MCRINWTGAGSDHGKRMVPLITLYGASSSLNAATIKSLAPSRE